MGMRPFWVLAAALAVSFPAADRAAAAAAAAPFSAAAPGAPVVIIVPHGLYAFEAERAAKARGCQGPDGIRPAAQLRLKNGAIEEYDVACTAGVQRVRCDMGMCSAAR